MAHIRPIGGKIGVEVSGVDVRRLDDDGFAPIYRAWLDHGVMVVTGQDLTKAEFQLDKWDEHVKILSKEFKDNFSGAVNVLHP